MLARMLLFQINIVMNLLNSDSSDAFGEVDLDEISALVCDTLRKLRLAVRQLDNEVSDLSNLKREILKANPTIEERRASILRQLDYSAQEENLPTIHLDNQLLQALTQSYLTDDAGVKSVCKETSQEEFASTSSSQEETPEINNNRCIEAPLKAARFIHALKWVVQSVSSNESSATQQSLTKRVLPNKPITY